MENTRREKDGKREGERELMTSETRVFGWLRGQTPQVLSRLRHSTPFPCVAQKEKKREEEEKKKKSRSFIRASTFIPSLAFYSEPTCVARWRLNSSSQTHGRNRLMTSLAYFSSLLKYFVFFLLAGHLLCCFFTGC